MSRLRIRTSIITQGALAVFLFLLLAPQPTRADSTWVYTVQLSATVQSSPPQIMLQWPPDQYGANSYTVYRKAKDATSWGMATATLPGSATNYADSNVVVGATYEYQVAKAATLGYAGYGYIFSGINAELVENRGTVLLLVAANAAAPLATELQRLQSDLVGDGWQVIQHDVSADATPQSVREIIKADYSSDPTHVNTVFLFGHLPVFLSGYLNYDSHGFRAMPADAYYGEMTDDWVTDPASSPSFIPSDIELAVGRVDMADMPGVGAPTPWPSEVELLREYLNKDHNWRFKLLTAPRRAVVANRSGDRNGIAPAATGYRNFEPLVGPGNTIEVATADDTPAAQRWISIVSAGPYLLSCACGGGNDNSLSDMGTHGLYDDVWSTDIVGQQAKVIFAMFNGSHFGEWYRTDNLLRSVLATPGYGLTACLAGGPQWYVHHLGLGETIGYGTRLSMNNSTLYLNQSNYLARAVYTALMGDPTLRLEPVTPPSNLQTSTSGAAVTLSWAPSPDAVSYQVYRAASANGPFSRISGSGVSTTNFTDYPGSGTYTYMVRAIMLQTNPSGSYYDPSQGVFAAASASTGVTVVAPTVLSQRTSNGLLLTWTTQTGAVYYVQSRDGILSGTWTNASSIINGTGSSTDWKDTNGWSAGMRLYRITASPQ